MSSKKRNFKSKESTITHVCKKVMLEQNFSTHMRNIHKSNETRDASQMSITAMFTPEKRPLMEQESSAYSVADINVEEEQVDSLTSLSCQGESAETLELGEIQVCNKSSETDVDMTSIVVEDTYKSTDQPQDRPCQRKVKLAI